MSLILIIVFSWILVFEPTSALSKPLNVNVYSQPKTESLIENEAYLSTKMSTIGIKAATNQTYQNKLTNKKRRKRSRRKVQLKQRTTFGESSVIDEQPDDISEEEDPNSDEQDSEEDDHGENIRIYWKSSLASLRSCQIVAPEQVHKRFAFSKIPADRAIIPQTVRLNF